MRSKPSISTLIVSTLLALAPATNVWAAFEPINGKVVTIDGDTIALPCAVPARGCSEKVRILSIDTPETFRSRCETELALGLKAKARLRELLDSGPVSIERNGHDRFRRTLATVHVGQIDVGNVLIAEGFALPYQPGGVAKLARLKTWCGPDATLPW